MPVGLLGELGRVEQSPVRGLGPIIALGHPAPLADLLLEFLGGQEEVHVRAQESVKLVEYFQLRLRVVAGVARKPTHHQVVLLLHEAVVVLAQRPRAGKGDLFLLAVTVQLVVDEFRAVVRVQSQQLKGKPFADLLQRLEDPDLGFVPNRR